LKELEDRYRLITENSNDLIRIFDKDFNFEYINEANHLKQLGYLKQDLVGMNANIIVHPDEYDQIDEMIKQMLKEGEARREGRIKHKNGEWKWYDIWASLIEFQNDNWKALLISRDITERKIVEQKLQESEKILNDFIQSATDSITIWDSNLNLLEINEIALERMGMHKKAIIGKNMLEIIPEIKETGRYDKYLEVLKTGNSITFEEIKTLPNIKEGYYNINAFKVGDGVGVMSSDITERKFAEEKLKESEERYRLIVENAGAVVWTTDMNLNLTYVSPNSPKILGYTVEEAISLPINTRLTDQSMAKITNILKDEFKIEAKKVKDLDRSRTFETEQIHKNSSIIPVEITITFLRDDNGNATGILGVSRDISERKLAEQMLKDSELRFRELYEEAPNGYFSIRTDGKIIRCNKAVTNLLGYSNEELLEMSVFDLYADTEDGILKAKECFQTFLNGEQIKDEELQMKQKNGEYIWISLTVKPILDGNDKIIESQSMIIDIRKRKKAELEVANLAKFPSENPSAVLRVDREKIIYANKAAENLFDIRSEDKLPRILKNYVENTYNEKIVKSFEVNLKDRIYSLTITPVKDIDYVNIYGMDITDRKVAEQKIIDSEKKYRDAFERANLYKDLFAHDINNLLQIINSSAELISYQLNGVENVSDIQNISKIIKKQVQRGSKLITNVRTLSDLEDKDIELRLLDSCEILKNSIDFINKAYSERDINISINCKEDKYLINASELLQDVFENLLINAIKYNENQKIEIDINALKELKENRNYIKFEFIDNAMGIPNDKKGILFKEGYRREKGTKGMGLGLSLVYKIVHSFNGKIWVEDRIEGDYTKGSKFILLIPEYSY